MKANQTEIHIAHLYNRDAMIDIAGHVRAAERLGYDVEILVRYDGMHKVHSLQVFASKEEKKI